MNTKTIKKNSTLGVLQRQKLEELFKQRYRNKPTYEAETTYHSSGPLGPYAIAQEIEEVLLRNSRIQRALRLLELVGDEVEKLYGEEGLLFAINNHGNLTVTYSTEDYSNNRTDFVNKIRQSRNTKANSINNLRHEDIRSDVEAWEKEKEEKILAIHTARNIEELLMVVPELRANLPTPQDLIKNQSYIPSQITAGNVVLDV